MNQSLQNGDWSRDRECSETFHANQSPSEGCPVQALLAALVALGLDALLGMRVLMMALEALLARENPAADLAKMPLQTGLEKRVVEGVGILAVRLSNVARQVLQVGNFEQAFGTSLVDSLVLRQFARCRERIAATGRRVTS